MLIVGLRLWGFTLPCYVDEPTIRAQPFPEELVKRDGILWERRAAGSRSPVWQKERTSDDQAPEATLRVQVDQLVLNGFANQGGQIVDIELGHQVGAMLFDGLNADTKGFGDSIVGMTFGN